MIDIYQLDFGKVRDIMVTDPIVLRLWDPIQKAIEHFNKTSYRAFPILDEEDRPVGVVRDYGILKLVSRLDLNQLASKELKDIMFKPPVVVSPDDDILVALQKLLEPDVLMAIVVEKGRMVGVVYRHDFLKKIVQTGVELKE